MDQQVKVSAQPQSEQVKQLDQASSQPIECQKFTIYKWIVSDRNVYVKQVTNEGSSDLYRMNFMEQGITKPTAYRRIELYQKGKVLQFSPQKNQLRIEIETKERVFSIVKADEETAIKRNRMRVRADKILEEFRIAISDEAKLQSEAKVEESQQAEKVSESVQKPKKRSGSKTKVNKEKESEQIKTEQMDKDSKKKKKRASKSKDKDKPNLSSEQKGKGKSKKKKKQKIQQAQTKQEQLEQIKTENEGKEKEEQKQVAQEGSLQEKEEADKPKKGKRRTRKQIQQARQQHQKNIESILKLKNQRAARQDAENQLRLQKQLLTRFGTKILFEVSKTCKYREQYRIGSDTLQKRGKLYSQLYGAQQILSDRKCYFEVKMMRLAFPNVTIGVIADDNFDFQYSRDKTGCLCFDAYTHSVYVQGQKIELQANLFVNDIVRTIVDVPGGKIEWYINNDSVAVAAIPELLAVKPLYPHLQISNKGIKLRLNNVEE